LEIKLLILVGEKLGIYLEGILGMHGGREGEGGRKRGRREEKRCGRKGDNKEAAAALTMMSPLLPPGKTIKRPARVLVPKRAGP